MIYEEENKMLDYQKLPRLPTEQCRRRFETAKKALGERVLVKLLAFALFTLGANRRKIAEELGLPKATLTSLTERVLGKGLPALEDRRSKSSTFLPQAAAKGDPLALYLEQDTIVIQVNEIQHVVIPRQNVLQCRIVLLTMLESGLLSPGEVARGLDLSTERVRQLSKKLREGGARTLLDQRKGQQQDYRVTPDVKAEIIQQYVVNLQTDGRTSAEKLKDDLSSRCKIELAPRTIRLHVAKLGLQRIRGSLPELLATLKKTE